jgi:hypothetical protein
MGLLVRRYLTTATKARMELYGKEKMLQDRTRLSSFSGPKNAGIEPKVVRTEETVLQKRKRHSSTRPEQESAGLEPEVGRRKVAAKKRTRRSPTVSGQEPAGLESEVVGTKARSENVFLLLSVTLCSQLWSKG